MAILDYSREACKVYTISGSVMLNKSWRADKYLNLPWQKYAFDFIGFENFGQNIPLL